MSLNKNYSDRLKILHFTLESASFDSDDVQFEFKNVKPA